MKLREIPSECVACGERMIPPCYRVRIDMLIPKPEAARGVLGVATILGGPENGKALAIAEALAPDAEVVALSGDAKPPLIWMGYLCIRCVCGTEALAQIIEHDT